MTDVPASSSYQEDQTICGDCPNPSDEAIRLAPFNPTCTDAQDIALELLSLQTNDVLFDLGCGDGRFLIAAAGQTPGLRCVGIELDPVYASRAVSSVEEMPSPIKEHIEIRRGDALDKEIQDPDDAPSLQRDATAIFLYLVPTGLEAMKPILDQMRRQKRKEGPPLRIVTYMFCLRGWEPSRVERTRGAHCPLYLYVTGTSVEATGDIPNASICRFDLAR